MPEVLEVEATRRAASVLLGRTFTAVERTDPLIVGDGVDAAVERRTVTGLDRRGKLLLVVTDGPLIGIHFGMTGRLIVDDVATIDRLVYGATSDDPVWDRWIVGLEGGGRVRLHDPRRLGRVLLEPAVDRLGPDAMALTKRQLHAALRTRRAPLKAVLLDQTAVAGLGNMLVDEVLWRAGLDPHRPAASLSAEEVAALQRTIRRRLPLMGRRGGATQGRCRRRFGRPAARARATAPSCGATWSVGARRSGVVTTNTDLRGSAAVPTTGSSGPLGIVGSTGTTVLLLVGALAALGVTMIVVAVWLVRSTRTDHVSLGPLEVMGDRSFRRADETARSTRLTTARPDGAPVPAPIVPLEEVEQVEEPEEAADAEAATADAQAVEDVVGEPLVEPVVESVEDEAR